MLKHVNFAIKTFVVFIDFLLYHCIIDMHIIDIVIIWVSVLTATELTQIDEIDAMLLK